MTEMLMLGYDYLMFERTAIKIPIYAPLGHLICVGGSNSGKTTSILYWIYKCRKFNIKWYITDFKRSRDFFGITSSYAEYEDVYDMIRDFYQEFLEIPEGGAIDGRPRVLLVDEVAGLLMHLSLSKSGKEKADELRSIFSSILMLGRSRKCFIWMVMQRYTASIFPSSSGGADNFYVAVGLGRLSVDGRKGLFAGEHFEGEEKLNYSQGKGIVLIDGQPLKSLIIPTVSKNRLRELLT